MWVAVAQVLYQGMAFPQCIHSLAGVYLYRFKGFRLQAALLGASLVSSGSRVGQFLR